MEESLSLTAERTVVEIYPSHEVDRSEPLTKAYRKQRDEEKRQVCWPHFGQASTCKRQAVQDLLCRSFSIFKLALLLWRYMTTPLFYLF